MGYKTFLRMLDSHGETIKPMTAGYRQLVALGQHLADLWPGVASVLCHHTYITAYNTDDVRRGILTYESLPETIQAGLVDLDLDDVVMEFWRATAEWIEL